MLIRRVIEGTHTGHIWRPFSVFAKTGHTRTHTTPVCIVPRHFIFPDDDDDDAASIASCVWCHTHPLACSGGVGRSSLRRPTQGASDPPCILI